MMISTSILRESGGGGVDRRRSHRSARHQLFASRALVLTASVAVYIVLPS